MHLSSSLAHLTHAPCATLAATPLPHSLLFSPPGHSLPNSLGPGGSCWLMTTRCLVATVPLSSQSQVFAFQLSREPQVLAQLSNMGLIAPKIPIQRLSFMKYKAADQVQDSAPQGTLECWPSSAGCGTNACQKVL